LEGDRGTTPLGLGSSPRRTQIPISPSSPDLGASPLSGLDRLHSGSLGKSILVRNVGRHSLEPPIGRRGADSSAPKTPRKERRLIDGGRRQSRSSGR